MLVSWRFCWNACVTCLMRVTWQVWLLPYKGTTSFLMKYVFYTLSFIMALHWKFQRARLCRVFANRVTNGMSELSKTFEMLMYISKIFSWDPQANESKFEKIDLWQIWHANRNINISSVETLVAKKHAVVILWLWH